MEIMIKLKYRFFNKFIFCNFFLQIFVYNFSIYVKKCLKIYQLNIIKKIKEDSKARERFQNLSREEKDKKQQYGHENYKNLSEDEKEKLVEYRKKYYRMRKKALL